MWWVRTARTPLDPPVYYVATEKDFSSNIA